MAYVMIPDETSVKYSSNLIKKVICGNKLDNNGMDDVSIKVNNTNDNNSKEIVGNSKLTVRLIRSNITLIKGEEYIYHGFTALYDGEDVSNDKDLEEEFVVDGQSFDDYRDLVRYITYNLESGSYVVKYNISYKGESKVLNQNVTITES